MPEDRSRQLSSQLLWLQPVNRPVTPMLDGFLEVADLSCITHVEIGTKALLVDPVHPYCCKSDCLYRIDQRPQLRRFNLLKKVSCVTRNAPVGS